MVMYMAKIFDIDYATKDEIIVEKMLWNGRFSTVAKVIVEHRHENNVLTKDGLDTVLKALNWRHTHTERVAIPNGIYNGLWGIRGDGFAVVFMSELEGFGSDVFLRRHDNPEFGIFYDVAFGGWRNDSRKKAVEIIKQNMNIKI